MILRPSFENFMRYNRLSDKADMPEELIKTMKKIPICLDYLSVNDEDMTHCRKVVASQSEENATFGMGIVLSFPDEPRAVWGAHMDVAPAHIQGKLDRLRGNFLGGYAGLDIPENIFYTAAGNPLFYRVLREKIGHVVACQSPENVIEIRKRKRSRQFS